MTPNDGTWTKIHMYQTIPRIILQTPLCITPHDGTRTLHSVSLYFIFSLRWIKTFISSDSLFHTEQLSMIHASYWFLAVNSHLSYDIFNPITFSNYADVFALLLGLDWLCFHSLRCLKSALSWLNMSVIPSTERGAFKSISASAVNLQTQAQTCTNSVNFCHSQ